MVMSMLFMIHSIVNDKDSRLTYSLLQYLLPELARLMMVIIVILLCIWKSDWMVERIVKEDSELNAAGWSPAGVYRLAIVIIGGFFVYDSVREMSSQLGKIIDYGIRIELEGAEWGMYSTQLLSSIILLALGIYLLTGAPHLVKWQVKKSLEQCNELEDGKPDTAQS